MPMLQLLSRDEWKDLAVLLGVVTAALALAGILWKRVAESLAARLVRHLLLSDRMAGAQVVQQLLIHDRAGARDRMEKLLAERLIVSKQTRELAEMNADRLDAVEASQLAQGRALTEQFTAAMAGLTRSMDSMTVAMRDVHSKLEVTSDEVAEIRGFLKAGGWDGVERRRRARE